MKIACLQFATRVGEIDNNLTRADAVLNKANVQDLEGLDLLVLPELAFSGANFKSLREISPFLEPSGAGISSLWARTTALKYDCAVVVGYPEQVDVSAKWPASPEYYNSAIVVSNDGDTIGNYRKRFLDHADETWALEGNREFFRRRINGMGRVVLGVGMDVNPYRFEAPWDAFEFGYHALDASANVVILTMAWRSQDDTGFGLYSCVPREPDLDTLIYWVQRLEPLISADTDEEVIVVVCNKTGSENDVMYTGTSAVLGVKKGEVFVYGILGRGAKDLLVVDTSKPPVSKLTEAESAKAKDFTNSLSPIHSAGPDTATSPFAPYSSLSPSLSFPPVSSSSPRSQPSTFHPINEAPEETDEPAQSKTHLGGLDENHVSIDQAIMGNSIPQKYPSANPSSSPISPQKHLALPRLTIPSAPWRFSKKASPFPRDSGVQPQYLAGKVAMTPITPQNLDGAIDSALPKPVQHQEVFKWALKAAPSVIQPPKQASPALKQLSSLSLSLAQDKKLSLVYSPVSPKAFLTEISDKPSNDDDAVRAEAKDIPSEETEKIIATHKKLETEASPKTDNLDSLPITLQVRPRSRSSPVKARDPGKPTADRPSSQKPRNDLRSAALSRLMHLANPVPEKQEESLRDLIPIAVKAGEDWRPRSIQPPKATMDTTSCDIARPSSRPGQRVEPAPVQHVARRHTLDTGRSRSVPVAEDAVLPAPRGASIGHRDQAESRQSRSLLRSPSAQAMDTQPKHRGHTRRQMSQQDLRSIKSPEVRNVSRGRQPVPKATLVELSTPTRKNSGVSRRHSEQNLKSSTPSTKYRSVVAGSELQYPTISPRRSGGDVITRNLAVPLDTADTGAPSPCSSTFSTPQIERRASPRAEMMKRMTSAAQESSPRTTTRVGSQDSPSRHTVRSPYRISVLPPPTTTGLPSAGGAGLLSASTMSPFENSPEPLTPNMFSTTPEPSIVNVNANTSPRIGTTEVESFGNKMTMMHDELTEGRLRLQDEMMRSGLQDDLMSLKLSW
ncbi:hypothetical protein OQA88_6427 [Cercophora sp. LCS_1]